MNVNFIIIGVLLIVIVVIIISIQPKQSNSVLHELFTPEQVKYLLKNRKKEAQFLSMAFDEIDKLNKRIDDTITKLDKELVEKRVS